MTNGTTVDYHIILKYEDHCHSTTDINTSFISTAAIVIVGRLLGRKYQQ